MDPDDEICYCYHVSMRKLVNYAKRTRPERPSQMTGCLNAGTGCGWCIPFLKELHAQHQAGNLPNLEVSPETYADQRAEYRTTGKRSEGEQDEGESDTS